MENRVRVKGKVMRRLFRKSGLISFKEIAEYVGTNTDNHLVASGNFLRNIFYCIGREQEVDLIFFELPDNYDEEFSFSKKRGNLFSAQRERFEFAHARRKSLMIELSEDDYCIVHGKER